MPNALVIDDNRMVADTLCDMLGMLGMNARAAYSPRTAVESLSGFSPQVVLLDLNMPGLNGLEVLRYLKRDPAFKDIPVVVVTADPLPQTAWEAKNDGALAVIVKPATLESLQAALKQAGIS